MARELEEWVTQLETDLPLPDPRVTAFEMMAEQLEVPVTLSDLATVYRTMIGAYPDSVHTIRRATIANKVLSLIESAVHDLEDDDK